MEKLAYILAILSSSICYSQDFSNEITRLNQLGKEILAAETDEAKLETNSVYKTELNNLINKENSFEQSFDSIKTISILKAHNLKIYNWTIPFADGTFEYFAYLQIKTESGFSVVELIDKSEEVKSPENKTLTSKSWYGALYYKLIYHKKLGENTYTLLGWDGNNMLTNKKIIDVVTISGNGMIKLGSPIFKLKNKTQRRVIFEYSENAVMSLKYHPNREQIIFDFLVPSSSKLKDIYEYYGPALNRFDALTIQKGKWVYEDDINIELDRNIKDHMWVDPKKK
ncbi:MAG: hypothetical protein P1U41_05885 [Vicingaceae bacterium]|nr:hypothetical protein [Vicingaceae bacterium]